MHTVLYYVDNYGRKLQILCLILSCKTHGATVKVKNLAITTG